MRVLFGVAMFAVATNANADEITDEPPITQPYPQPAKPAPLPRKPTVDVEALPTPAPSTDALDEPPPGRPGAPLAKPTAPPPRFEVVPRSETPPLSESRIAGEIVVGAIVALPIGAIGAAVGAAGATGEGLSGAGVAGAYAGGVIGVGLGVYAAGSWGDQRGSFAATMGGALAGGATSGLLLYLGTKTMSGDEEDNAILLTVALTAPPFIGALVGFNLTRGYEPRRVRVGSLLNFDGTHANLGVPLVVGDTLSLASGAF